MKQLYIQWKYLDSGGETCERCLKTGETIQKVINDLKEELESKGFKIIYKEVPLSEKDISQSNIILINDIPIEHILSDASVTETDCCSCSTIIGKSTCCRAVKHEDNIYEDIPYELVYKAIKKVATD